MEEKSEIMKVTFLCPRSWIEKYKKIYKGHGHLSHFLRGQIFKAIKAYEELKKEGKDE